MLYSYFANESAQNHVSNHVLITVSILANGDDLHLLCDKYAEEKENQSVNGKRKRTKTAKGKALKQVENVDNGDVEATSSTSASQKRKKEPQSAQSPKNKKSKNVRQSEKQSKRSANVEAAQLRAKHSFKVMQDQEHDDDLQQITYAEQTQLLNQTANINNGASSDKNVQLTPMSNEQPPNNERQTPITKERRTPMANKQRTPMIDDQRTVTND